MKHVPKFELGQQVTVDSSPVPRSIRSLGLSTVNIGEICYALTDDPAPFWYAESRLRAYVKPAKTIFTMGDITRAWDDMVRYQYTTLDPSYTSHIFKELSTRLEALS